MNEKIGSQVTLLKYGNKGSVMWVVTPIPHWLRKRLNMDIYRLMFSLWVGPQGVPQFYERSEHLHAYGSTTCTRMPPASLATTRLGQAGLGYECECALAKPYLFGERLCLFKGVYKLFGF